MLIKLLFPLIFPCSFPLTMVEQRVNVFILTQKGHSDLRDCWLWLKGNKSFNCVFYQQLSPPSQLLVNLLFSTFKVYFPAFPLETHV